jgi:hypothetical protein
VRLDHLLSKEHPRPPHPPRGGGGGSGPVFTTDRVVGGLLIGGALAIRSGGVAPRLVPPVRPRPGGEWERGTRGAAWPGTLLGPEETGHQPLTLNLPPCGVGWVRWRGRGVAWGLWCHTQGFRSFCLVTGGMWVGWLSVF